MNTIRTVILSFLINTPVIAAGVQSANIGDNLELRLGAAMLNGESGEFVYDADGSGSGIPGYKVSELQWQLNNVPMAGLGFTLESGKAARFNIDYWVNAADGDGTMDDYDWLYVGLDWSHWSHHPDTTVRKAEMMDISGEYTFSRERKRGVKSSWSGVVGYRRDFFDWQAKGGTGIYSSEPYTLASYRDTYVIFPNVPGLTYQQTFTTPYLGLSYNSVTRNRKSNYVTRLNLLYSAWAEGEDVDIHHLRDLRFEEKGSGGEWYKFGLEVDFNITKQMLFTIGYSRQTYKEIKASISMTDLTTGITTVFPGDAAGLSHTSELISIGLNYLF